MALRVAREGVEVLVDFRWNASSPPTACKTTDLVKNVRAMILESSPDGAVAALGAMRERPDSTPLLGEIGVPTLVVGGEEDGIASPRSWELWPRRYPGPTT